jgi:hypothetical protein
MSVEHQSRSVGNGGPVPCLALRGTGEVNNMHRATHTGWLPREIPCVPGGENSLATTIE